MLAPEGPAAPEDDAVCGSSESKTPRSEKPVISAICVKCNTHPSVTVFRGSSTCWPCFEERFVHGFRTALSKVRENSPKNQVQRLLLAFSGGHSSRAMLHMQHECLGENRTGKRMFFEVSVLHVDESAVAPPSGDQLLRLRAIVVGYKFPLSIVPLQEIFMGEGGVSTLLEASSKLQRLLEEATTLTAKEDLVSHLRLALISRVAQQQGITKILIGESASRLAVNIFASTAKGRGFNLPADIELFSHRLGEQTLAKPMRDLLLKEIAVYNTYKKLEVVQLGTMAPPKASLNQISEGFIFGLQEEFPHTVPTILRSVEKLKTATPSSALLCPLCSGYLSPGEIEAIARASRARANCESCDCGADSAACSDLSKNVCYGCRKLLQEGPRSFPTCILQRAEKVAAEAKSEKLRAAIQDYLVNDDELPA